MAPRTRVLSTVPVDDERANRFQRHVVDTLNPVLRSLEAARGDSSARPAANESYGGTFYRVKDAGLPERLTVCLQNSDGSWSWCDCALAPR